MKVDFKKSLAAYSAKTGKFEIKTIPVMRYLMVDGHGDPNTSKEFVDAIEALYPVAYNLKFMSKARLDKDYVVPPMEGLWWADDMAAFSTKRDKSKWDWTLMLMVPDWITEEMFQAAVDAVVSKKQPVSLAKVRLETLDEGLCVQTLHIGSFESESETLEKMHSEFIPQNNLRMAQKHHEIYLSDMRRTAPEKLRTILRQPVVKV